MASCVKCGKRRLHKDREGRFRCRICGPRQIYTPPTWLLEQAEAINGASQ